MRKILGISCMIIGILFLLLSAGFIIYNQREAEAAEASVQTILKDVQNQMEEKESAVQETVAGNNSEEFPKQMQVTQLQGYDCIGILSVPVLKLELPVLNEWSYEKLKKSPCQYYGSCYETDFVIAAHNYPSHFGRLSELQSKDLILFTDAEGTVYCYEVILLETLPATATEEMITSGFDLSLYTCTPGGKNRVTVRCNKVSKDPLQ